jgi:hypothetical protein
VPGTIASNQAEVSDVSRSVIEQGNRYPEVAAENTVKLSANR